MHKPYPVYGSWTCGEALVCTQSCFLFGVVVNKFVGERRSDSLEMLLLASLVLPVQQIDRKSLRVIDSDLVAAAWCVIKFLNGARAR